MKPTHYYIVVAAATACVVLAIAAIVMGYSNQKLQEELQRQQEEINRGNLMQQVGTNILRDIAQLSVENEELRQLLAKHGFNVQVTPPAEGAPSSPGEPSPTPRF